MKSASLKEIKTGLEQLNPDALIPIFLRLARYKKENKELLTYLLFEADHQETYIESVREELALLFTEIPDKNVYFIKKSLRKILRFMNRHIRYSEEIRAGIELRIFFCHQIKNSKIPLKEGSALYKIFSQELNKIEKLVSKLPEDLKADYEPGIKALYGE